MILKQGKRRQDHCIEPLEAQNKPKFRSHIFRSLIKQEYIRQLKAFDNKNHEVKLAQQIVEGKKNTTLLAVQLSNVLT